MEKVIYATVGRQERPIFSAYHKTDRAVFEGHKAAFVSKCLKEGLPTPSFREEDHKVTEDKQ